MPELTDRRQAMSSGRSLQALRDGTGLDAIIVTSPPNTQALTGCNIPNQRLFPDRLAVVVSTGSSEAFVVSSIEEGRVRGAPLDVRTYVHGVTSPIAAAVEAIRSSGSPVATVGYEARHLVARYYDELRDAFPGASFVPVDTEVARLRARKTPDEARAIEAAFRATDAAIASAFSEIRRGASTLDISGALKRKLVENGADDVKFVAIGAGAMTLQGRPEGTPEPIAAGSPLRVDVGGTFRGFFSDLARSCFVGAADEEQRETYRRLWAAFEETIAAVEAGVKASAIYEEAQAAMTGHGLPLNRVAGSWENSLVGHGIGLSVHEFPILGPDENTKLEAGMLVCVELFYTKPGSYRLHVEDAVLIGESGPSIVSRTRDWSEPLTVGV